MSAKFKKYLNVLAVLVFSSGLTFGQERSPARGVQAGQSYAISDIENINLSNGNLNLNIPLATVPGRGSDPGHTVTLRYDSYLWDAKREYMTDGTGIPDAPGATTNEYTRDVLRAGEHAGWKLDAVGYKLIARTRMDVEPDIPCHGPNAQGEEGWLRNAYQHRVEMRLPDGSIKEFRPYGTGAPFVDVYHMSHFPVNMNGTWMQLGYSTGQGPNPSCSGSQHQITTGMNYYTIDGSRMRLFVPYNDNDSWVLYSLDGSVVENLPNDDSSILLRRTDRNGNKITWKEGTWGTYGGIKISNDVGQFVIVSGTQVVRPGFNGEPLVTEIEWDETWVYRKYQTTHAQNAYSGSLYEHLDTSVSNVTSITLPEGLGEYQFTYNGAATQQAGTNYTDGFGELKSISLPSGASAEYEHILDDPELIPSACTPTFGASASCNGAEDGFVLHNAVTKKDLKYDLEYDGSSDETTETTLYNIEAGVNGTSTVTAPDGSVTTQSGGYFGTRSYPQHTIRADGTKIENLYARNEAPRVTGYASGSTFIGVNVYVKTEYTSIKDASGNYSLTAIKDFDYDKNGNLLEVREYDWVAYDLVHDYDLPTGLPTSGLTLKRKTVNTYHNPTPIATDWTTDDGDHYANPSAPTKLKNVLKSTEIQDGSSNIKARSEFFYDDADDIGNLTETKVWDSTKGALASPDGNGFRLNSGNSISSFAEYDTYGNVIETTDAKGTVTQITYGTITTPTGTVSGLYPTQTVAASNYSALKRTSTATYDFYTGLVKTTTDVDNGVTNAMVYDDLGRPTKAISAQGTALESWTQTIYDDAARRVIVKSDLETVGDGKKVAIQHFDQLGRVRLSRTLENSATEDPTDETDGIKVQTRYKTVSGYTYQLSSNPYRAATSGSETDPTMGWTLSTAWSNGKRAETQSFTGAGLPTAFGGSNTNSTGAVKTEIDADRTLVTDQAGKKRISKTNALGQLKEIWEILAASETGSESVAFPNTSVAHGFKTTYSYNTLGKMVDVHQGAQHRYFMYDSLGRMLRVRQPEQEVNTALNTSSNLDNNSWTAGFTYDNNGNVLTATDAKGTTITNTYDALNRVTQRSYNDTPQTPTVTFIYDEFAHSKGQLTKVSSSVSESKYVEFDVAGRLKQFQQVTDGQTYTSKYTYNLSGALIEEEYPSGRKVKNEFDQNGDLAKVTSQKTSTSIYRPYASNFSYNAAGMVSHMKYGNNRWETAKFNSRLQATELGLGNSATNTSVWKTNYEYGVLQTDGTVDGIQNSGNIGKQTLNVPGTSFVQSYEYDSLYRLTDAIEKTSTTTNWSQEFGYDRYGNRTSFNQTIGSTTVNTTPAVDANTNRFTSTDFGYDENGNIVEDIDSATSLDRDFIFNGDNKQFEVKKDNVTIGRYYYDGEGKRVKKVTDSETTVFVYSGGKLIAEYSTQLSQAPYTSYLTNDHLGSPRIITNELGQVKSRRDFMPFGEELDVNVGGRTESLEYSSSADEVRQKFTGYQKDSETDLDFAEARMYKSNYGRFTAVDPLLASGKSDDPQSFNRYVYVMNDPLKFVDPNGLCSVPSGLKQGQVGICVEAFIQAKRVNGLGHGDGRSHEGNTPDLSTRMRVSFIVDAHAREIDIREQKISPSSAGIPIAGVITSGGGPSGTVTGDIPLGTLQATGRIEVSGSGNIAQKTGDFGNTTINVSLKDGANGFQALGKGMQNSDFRAVQQAGSIVEAAAPPGTIDLNATIKITGGGTNINVSAPERSARPFPSYTAYAYTIGADGKVITTELFRRDETVPSDLPKPMTRIP